MKIFLFLLAIFLIFGCGDAADAAKGKKILNMALKSSNFLSNFQATCVKTKNCTGDFYFSYSKCDCKWFCADYFCDANKVLKYDCDEDECKCVCPEKRACTAFNQRF